MAFRLRNGDLAYGVDHVSIGRDRVLKRRVLPTAGQEVAGEENAGGAGREARLGPDVDRQELISLPPLTKVREDYVCALGQAICKVADVAPTIRDFRTGI